MALAYLIVVELFSAPSIAQLKRDTPETQNKTVKTEPIIELNTSPTRANSFGKVLRHSLRAPKETLLCRDSATRLPWSANDPIDKLM